MHHDINASELLSRQADFVPRMDDLSVALIGVGGLGSNLARTLASLGVRHMTLIDPDEVEEGNVYPGWFSLEDVGTPKVDVVANRLGRYFWKMETTRVPDRIENVPMDFLPEMDAVFAVTDNITSRREAWQRITKSEWHHPRLWFDARMGGDGYTVITFRLDDEDAVNRYNRYEIAEGEPNPLPCGMRATAFVTHGIVPYLAGATLSLWQKDEKFPYIYHGEAIRPADIIGAGAAI